MTALGLQSLQVEGPRRPFALEICENVTTMTYHLAYLDPGTGSFLLQVAAGGLFGGLYVIKRFWRQAKGAIINKASAR